MQFQPVFSPFRILLWVVKRRHETGILNTGQVSFNLQRMAKPSPGETDGMVKVLADNDDTIIGVHIIGPHASDLISEGTLMVKNRMKIADITGVIHPHPTLCEALLEAVLDVQGQAIHLTPAGR